MRSKGPKRQVRIESARYLVRTATIADASDRWGGWMADAEASRMLNAPAKALTKGEIESYVRSFDQRERLLLVICDKAAETIVGCFRIDIDEAQGRFLVNAMIGEPDYRHKGVITELTVPFCDYFFDTLGLKTFLCAVLSHNEPIIRFLLKAGFHFDGKIERQVKSRTEDAMLDLCYFSRTADSWRAWKRANLAGSQQTEKEDPRR